MSGSHRQRALDEHGRRCANCGASEGIEVHHRDGDRSNNEVSNLLPLCRHCHRRLHRVGLDGLEHELKPIEERSQIDPEKTTYQFSVQKVRWERWKQTVSRSKSLEQRLIELIVADTEGRVQENTDD